ncbi:MAG: hypothetical protein AMXMBFR34_07500 [Myxococcaceae bacterium]
MTGGGQARFHLAAVTALAVMMGRRLGLSRTRLSDACMSAAFHDIGLDELPPPAGEVVTPDELEALERVPLKTIVRLSEAALGGDALERIAVAWEHGQRASAGGLGFAQLLAVPCVFDRLTRPPPPRRVTLPDASSSPRRGRASMRGWCASSRWGRRCGSTPERWATWWRRRRTRPSSRSPGCRC